MGHSKQQFVDHVPPFDESDRLVGCELGTNRARGEGLGEGTFVVTAEGNSGPLDATGIGGPTAGREHRGIFELEGDTLKWCVNNFRGRTRPQAFETVGSNYFMILPKQK